MMKFCFYWFFLVTVKVVAGPYAPRQGVEGSTALLNTDESIVAWASEVIDYSAGLEVSAEWRDTSEALGQAEGLYDSIVCLGRGGVITLGFEHSIVDGDGDDFVVFENALSATFLELAFVEVSEDGVNFVRFSNDSVTANIVSSFGEVEPSNVTGLAGKYKRPYGVPFDLSDVGLPRVNFVRLVDVVGGCSRDTSGDLIYDPFPTFVSAGFDLDGVGVIHQALETIEIIDSGVISGQFVVKWSSEAGQTYVLKEWNVETQVWESVQSVTASGVMAEASVSIAQAKKRLLRVERS